MRARLTRYTLYLLLFCLCNCAKEKDFPYQNPYPLLEIVRAVADSSGIHVSAEIMRSGTSDVKEYGIIFHPASMAGDERKIKAPTVAEKIFHTIFQAQLIRQMLYEVKAYALVNDKIVYSNPVQVKSLITSQPTITDFSPQEGPSNTEVTITGTNFSSDRNEVQVYIGMKTAPVLLSEPDKIVIRVPNGSFFGSLPIRIVANGVEVETDKNFVIWGPKITGISKNEAVPGDTVTLFGEHLTASGTSPQIRLNGLAFKNILTSDTKIVLEVPFGGPNHFDKPHPIILSVGSKADTSSFSFIVYSNLKAETPPSGILTQTMPAIEVDGKGYFYNFYHLQSYTPATGVWKFEGESPWRNFPIWERIGDKAYLIGGSASSILREVWEFDLNLKSWKRLESLPFSVNNAASFVLNGKIYFAGGQNSLNDRYTLWQYDPATQQVRALNKLPGLAEYGKTFILKGKAHILLGENIMVYDQAADIWQVEARFHESNSFAITLGDTELYMLTQNLNSILYHYQSTTKTWKKVAYYPNSTSNPKSIQYTGFSANSKLYIGMFTNESINGNQFYSYTP